MVSQQGRYMVSSMDSDQVGQRRPITHPPRSSITPRRYSSSHPTGSEWADSIRRRPGAPQCSAACMAASRNSTSSAASPPRTSSPRHPAVPTPGRRATDRSTPAANAGIVDSRQKLLIQRRTTSGSSDSKAAVISSSAEWSIPSSSGSASKVAISLSRSRRRPDASAGRHPAATPRSSPGVANR